MSGKPGAERTNSLRWRIRQVLADGEIHTFQEIYDAIHAQVSVTTARREAARHAPVNTSDDSIQVYFGKQRIIRRYITDMGASVASFSSTGGLQHDRYRLVKTEHGYLTRGPRPNRARRPAPGRTVAP